MVRTEEVRASTEEVKVRAHKNNVDLKEEIATPCHCYHAAAT